MLKSDFAEALGLRAPRFVYWWVRALAERVRPQREPEDADGDYWSQNAAQEALREYLLDVLRRYDIRLRIAFPDEEVRERVRAAFRSHFRREMVSIYGSDAVRRLQSHIRNPAALPDEEIDRLIDDEVVHRREVAADERFTVRRDSDIYVTVTHKLSGITAGFMQEGDSFGTIFASKQTLASKRYRGLGIGYRLYLAGAEQFPDTARWRSSATNEASNGVRAKLHALDPYRWHWKGCLWCRSDLDGVYWETAKETDFADHP